MRGADSASSQAAEKLFPREEFPALTAIGVCRHVFTQRIPGVDVSDDKPQVLKRLEAAHTEIRKSIGLAHRPLITVEQIHGAEIAVVVDEMNSDRHLAGYDGLITNRPNVALGIHVADCCAVYIVDPATAAIGLVHSGRKGTELKITAKAIAQMQNQFGSNPENLIVQLSPCIRPPHYEVDFASEIIKQVRAQGVKEIHDSEVCTACHPDRYYSYRAEKGKTGRMLAMLALL